MKEKKCRSVNQSKGKFKRLYTKDSKGVALLLNYRETGVMTGISTDLRKRGKSSPMGNYLAELIAHHVPVKVLAVMAVDY